MSALPPRLWVTPWSAQIEADLDAADILVKQGIRSSTVCMLLQMVFEKLTKLAYSLGGRSFPNEHQCVDYLIGVLKRSPRYKDVYLPNRAVLAWVKDLEELNPSVVKARRDADRRAVASGALAQVGVYPQLEYPWVDAGKVLSPAKDLPILAQIQHPDDTTLQRTILFAKYLAKKLPELV